MIDGPSSKRVKEIDSIEIDSIEIDSRFSNVNRF